MKNSSLLLFSPKEQQKTLVVVFLDIKQESKCHSPPNVSVAKYLGDLRLLVNDRFS